MICPICHEKFSHSYKCPLNNLIRTKIKDIKDFSGTSPPQIFIGSKLTYPKVNVGVLSPPVQTENAWMYADQEYWTKNKIDIQSIINLRQNLINARFQTTVKSTEKFTDLAKEIGMAKNTVNIEVEVEKPLTSKPLLDKITLPSSPTASLQKLTLNENPKIPTKVDKVVSDTDLKAAEALKYLYTADFNTQTLQQLLSLGVLGIQKNRRLVPTRWSITASDDIITKQILEEVKTYPIIQEFTLHKGYFMGNFYLILLFQEIFSFELFETYLPRSSWNPSDVTKTSTDYEDHNGRKEYVKETAGGYYATRLPIVEYLKNKKRQAAVLVFRFETPEYWASLGVWVVRSSTKKALENKKETFPTKEQLLERAKEIGLRTYNVDITPFLKQSKLLNTLNTQQKLRNFF